MKRIQQNSYGIILIAALCVLCRYRHKVHWTAHKSRLDRNLKGKFGSKDYAFEELVAELGAAFCCADLGVFDDVQHESYIASWLTALQNLLP